ncbi:uncharacterized protein BP01DRAFT_75176 [Aspergillus saccharolyticus JOP 1030-1]|uniref:Uncharacterized protein n=1 Tax=Aspergillus saccharolyticus JOP 1030-1 TaxID=1450539 RepID=A0A318ZRP5_9EURO|nr:hypothetical protein BP01DRAFT_75176 [Aspergillus saccharolyticus JOP 1030-1]PYH49274.1 hypothetical protein BP01DRAFT_75176 [Aspergillus saccharolyticus JOP 1030-1]
MPHQVEQVVEPVVPVRELEADETYVLDSFESHASHCSRCANPLKTREEDRSLCKRGHQYARDVADYLRSKKGKIYSVVDLERNRSCLVKVPLKYAAARQLLLAIEDGLRVENKSAAGPRNSAPPVISYDATYPVAPRRITTQDYLRPSQAIIEREPRSLKRHRAIIYTSPRSSPSRGSLYESDAAERYERVKESSRIYRPTDYHR